MPASAWAMLPVHTYAATCCASWSTECRLFLLRRSDWIGADETSSSTLHNQRAENYVQRIANASRTKAGPMVRNATVMVKSVIVTPIDKALLEKKRSTIDDPIKRQKARVEGTERLSPILQRFKAVSKEADALRANDPELFHCVRELVNDPATLLATVVADRDAAAFELNMQQPLFPWHKSASIAPIALLLSSGRFS